MNTLILQAYLPDIKEDNPLIEAWLDIAALEFDDDQQLVYLTYLGEYSHQHFLKDGYYAASIRLPVELFPHQAENGWFAFLDDIMPMGASRRYWLKRLNLTRKTLAEQNYQLLKQATIAPVGHLRIKEATQHLKTEHNQKNSAPRLFTIEEVVNRDVDFLDYANEQGVIAGGATGAGGEAPKLLLRYRQNAGGDDVVWIDNLQQSNLNDTYYLVKYPRGKRSQMDCDILRAEYHFYNELHSMGFCTIDTKGMKLIEGKRYPSLWLPRFDVQVEKGATKRLAMESVYAVLQKGAGAYLNHEQCIRELIGIIEASQLVRDGFDFDKRAFVLDWVRRDLLNIAFGNSDNHGRNTAFLRDDNSIALAPIYDFAPMKADPEGIVRTLKWDSEIESGGRFRFDLIAEQLADLVEPKTMLDELNQTAKQLIGLQERLANRGVPASILNLPSMGFNHLKDRLTDWKVL